LACQQVLLIQEWLIASHLNTRFLLESTVAQRVWVSQQALNKECGIQQHKTGFTVTLRNWGQTLA
ncbi:MAG: hypothetical protein ACKO25_09390, partial [Cyanobium sp.]